MKTQDEIIQIIDAGIERMSLGVKYFQNIGCANLASNNKFGLYVLETLKYEILKTNKSDELLEQLNKRIMPYDKALKIYNKVKQEGRSYDFKALSQEEKEAFYIVKHHDLEQLKTNNPE